MNETNDFSTGKLFPMILKYSIPAAISLLITAIYNIVDRIFVGNFNGTSALAGLSICFPLSYMMMAFGLTCSAGGSSLFSLFAGKGEQKNMNRSFGNALLLVVVFEVFLSVFLLIFSNPILKIFGVTETAYEYALAYYRIVTLGCLFQGLTQVFCDYVRVSGRPVLGMCVTSIGAITNIILDAVFVAVLGWGVTGAAWATVIGQILSALFGAFLVLKGYTKAGIKKETFSFDWGLSKKIISCGFAFWIAQMAMGLISLVYNSQLGKYGGDTAISVYAVVASIMTFVIMPASGISQGIQPIVGNNFGAGNYKRVMAVLYQASALSVGITCIIWLIVMLFPEAILLTFGASEKMLEIGVTGLRTNFCITPILGFVMLVTTFFQSIAKPIPSIIITFLRQILFLIPFIYLFPMFWDINGIFAAQPVSDALALILSVVLVIREKRQLYQMADVSPENTLITE
ncbi:MATE family efflux transporter [Dorea acetigenes]|uniref:Multidrug export protein MepA n=1 Tax=Dorea acetigenes TaxID=2981787 RepID=A0ABT2RQX9_9FIRM|nr:MATE family efflux transporter [Dorea acetigenes]MCU6687778.1 MATE family efflux transporter [Dorea acetigenes]SCJ55443.1 Multidrug export protein mepA [uncultured Clostridium sp.]